jgi:hypothetical protein
VTQITPDDDYAESGAVGSITYPSCLLVDEHISRITRNVCARFCDPKDSLAG